MGLQKKSNTTYNRNSKRTLVVGEGFAQAKAGLQKKQLTVWKKKKNIKNLIHIIQIMKN